VIVGIGCEDFALRSFGFAKDAKPQDDNTPGRDVLRGLRTRAADRQNDKRGEGDGLIRIGSAV
jgi:hypothetical protein